MMSISVLGAIEKCPRQWALSRATYPQIWDRPGYPNYPYFGAIEGLVVHQSLETIVRSIITEGCRSISDPKVTSVLKSLGGFTLIIEKSIESVLSSYKANPRAYDVLDQIEKQLVNRTDTIRTNLQSLLGKITVLEDGRDAKNRNGASVASTRGELLYGSHPECELISHELHWKGFVDLLVLSKESCQLFDYKTGDPKEEHEDQVRFYALLWWRERELNPHSGLATDLVLVYPNETRRIDALDEKMLVEFEESMLGRMSDVIESISDAPPDTRINVEHCSFCHVRQLCDAYWDLEAEVTDGFCDVQISLTENISPSVWKGVIEKRSNLGQQEEIVFKKKNLVELELREKQRIRVLNAHSHTVESEDASGANSYRILTAGNRSEIFYL
jgi:CRISPR/Cas system-associated exonuclease Cas4 (RecB family)